MLFDCVVIGAGPAGLFFADRFTASAPAATIALVDAGVPVERRSCPLVDSGSCAQCKTCLAVYGGGGAGMYSDGKLSAYPAGSGLAAHLGSEERTIALNKEVLETITGTDDGGIRATRACDVGASELARGAQAAEIDLKSYDVAHLGSEGIQDFCIRFEDALAARGVDFRWRQRAVAVERCEGGFLLRLEHPSQGTTLLRARQIVFATGKASGTALRSMLATLGVRSRFNAIELGVRVEVPRDAVTPISACHLDAKIKMTGADGCEMRTFCMCDGGYLVSCYYDGFGQGKRICTISGYSLRDQKSDTSNFGLLVRKRFPAHVDPIAIQMPIIQAINLASGHGGTVVQRLEDFLARRPTTDDQLATNSVRTTLASSRPFDLNWLLPGYVVENIRAAIERLGVLSPKIASADTLLHAPVWELVNDNPQVDDHFETNVPGVYVIGDATGIARGIVQGATIGLVAAEHAAARVGAADAQLRSAAS